MTFPVTMPNDGGGEYLDNVICIGLSRARQDGVNALRVVEVTGYIPFRLIPDADGDIPADGVGAVKAALVARRYIRFPVANVVEQAVLL